MAQAVFAAMEVDCQISGRRLDAPGISITAGAPNPNAAPSIEVDVEGSAVDVAVPVLERVLREICIKGLKGRTLVFDFTEEVSVLEAAYRQTGRLIGTEVKLAGDGQLAFMDLVAKVTRRRFVGSDAEQEATIVAFTLQSDAIPFEQIKSLIGLLFKRQVLFVE
jgi:hypothetical protein